MSTVAMEHLLAFIESMGLSNRNRKWLAEKLMEPTQKTYPNYTIEELEFHLDKSQQEIAEGKTLTMDEVHQQMTEFINSL